MNKFKTVPLELKVANEYVAMLHRHHDPVYRDKFRFGASLDGKLVGVIQVGRPVSRNLDDGKTLEVVRLCTDGTKDVCSFLYSKAARIAKEMGYHLKQVVGLKKQPQAAVIGRDHHDLVKQRHRLYRRKDMLNIFRRWMYEKRHRESELERWQR